MAASSFQQAKQLFFQALCAHGFGAWISKPLEEKSFEAGEGMGYSAANIPMGYNSSNGEAMQVKQEDEEEV